MNSNEKNIKDLNWSAKLCDFFEGTCPTEAAWQYEQDILDCLDQITSYSELIRTSIYPLSLKADNGIYRRSQGEPGLINLVADHGVIRCKPQYLVFQNGCNEGAVVKSPYFELFVETVKPFFPKALTRDSKPKITYELLSSFDCEGQIEEKRIFNMHTYKADVYVPYRSHHYYRIISGSIILYLD